MSNFYVYIYLDPRKPGKYIYGNYCFLYEPFYVGKGKGNRYKEFSNRSDYFNRIIKKIKKCGFELLVVKLCENLNEEKSFLLEYELIKSIGRQNLNKGPLINFTDGGEGSSGRIVGEEIKKKMSENMKCEKNPFYGKKHSNKILEKQRKNFLDIEYEFKKRDYKLLTKKEDYKNNRQKLDYICSKNHIGKISWNKFKQGRGCSNCQYKLTGNDVILIKMIFREFGSEILQKDIGKLFGVKRKTISDIKIGKTWSHIKLGENINE